MTGTDEAADLIASGQEARNALITLARRSSAEFCRFVLRDEETGEPVENAPYHDEWHTMLAEHMRVVLWGHVESGKTQSISVGYALWRLGRNPNLRILIVSGTDDRAGKILSSIRGYIERSAELKAVFPKLVPGEEWTESAITVKRDTVIRDPSVQCIGYGGTILGARVDLLIPDDLVQWKNFRTKYQREKLIAWYRANLGGRITRLGQVLFIGNACHPEDIMHVYSKKPGYISKRYSVLMEDGTPRWPERWPLKRIAAWEGENGKLEADRQLRCLSRDETTRRCKDEWIVRCLEEGRGISMVRSLAPEDLPEGAFTVTGCDPAAKKKRAGARSVLYTILVYPDGDRQPLDIDTGQFSSLELRDKLIEKHDRYGSIVFVEDNGVQRWLLEMVGEKATIPILPFTTGGANKWHPAHGVESVFVELSQGKWVIPNEGCVDGDASEPANWAIDKGTALWIDGIQAYDPSEHTADELMACWFAKEGARIIEWQRRQDDDDDEDFDDEDGVGVVVVS